MGEPGSEDRDTVPSPGQEVDSGQDRQALSDNGQSVFGQPLATAQDHSDRPKDESSEKLSPRHERFPEKPPENHGDGGVSGGGGSGNGGGVGVSVTLLTLDADLDPRPHSRQHFLPTPRGTDRDRDPDMSDLKLIRDFQVRRKYGRRPAVHGGRRAKPGQHSVELGLSGTRYFTNGDAGPNGASSPADKKPPPLLEGPQNPAPVSAVVSRLRAAEEERGSPGESTPKDLQSPVPSFPPLSPGGPRAGGRSESSFYSSSRHSGQSPSLLNSHFGFSTIRPDTFSGMQRHRKLRLAADSDNDDLLKELEQHAQKQILACQNMGFTHRGSRAAESVLSLKHTVSPSAFHPSSFFTRHAPREGSRSVTPAAGGLGEGEERARGGGGGGRRVTPAGKLSMPRLVMPDRQERAARRTSTLPAVHGSSLQVVLAHSHAK